MKGMNLTYRIEGKGYTIMLDGVDWIVQDTFIPYPGETTEESAENHIAQIIADNEPQEEPVDEIAQLKQQLAETQDALIELAAIVAGGAN